MQFQQAKPVFPRGKEFEKNIFATFRAEIPSLQNATLYITASSFYQAYVNGKFIAFGPARTAKGYARVDALSLDGLESREKNEIVIAVTGYNVHSLSTVCQPAFLQAEIRCKDRVICYTGRDFVGYLPTCKVQKTERYSVQRHFSEIWDLRHDTSLTPEQAKAALAVVEHAPTAIDRRAPYPYYEDIPVKAAASGGTLTFDPTLPYRSSAYSFPPDDYWGMFPAEEVVSHPFEWVQRQRQTQCHADRELPLTLRENEYAILDFSRIETGFILLSAIAKGSTDIVIAFSEDASPVQFAFTNMNAQNVIELLLPDEKRVDFTSFEPYVMRYAMIAVRTGELRLERFGIKTFMHDIRSVHDPEIQNPTLAAIYRGAVRTFAHNAVDIYMDCPSRERAGWLCDSYFTGKTEFALFGNSQVESAFLENYRLYRNEGKLPAGTIPMCYPSDHQPTGHDRPNNINQWIKTATEYKFIPQWTMWFILEVEEYLRERAADADPEQFRPCIEGLLDFYKRYENEDGLLECLPSWNFVEWSVANEWTQDVSYPTNFLYAQVLEAVSRLFGEESYLKRSREVREKAVAQSFNGRVFLDHAIRDEHHRLVRQDDCSEACQYYAILFGGIDMHDPKYAELYRLVTTVFGATRREEVSGIAEINAFIGAYLRLEALLKMDENALVLRDIEEFFGSMEAETGTLWEYRERKGSRDHGFASYALVAMTKALEKQK